MKAGSIYIATNMTLEDRIREEVQHLMPREKNKSKRERKLTNRIKELSGAILREIHKNVGED